MAPTVHTPAQMRQTVWQLPGFFTRSLREPLSNASTLLLQNFMQVLQPVHFSGSMTGASLISTRAAF